jgi:hypothetical protein
MSTNMRARLLKPAVVLLLVAMAILAMSIAASASLGRSAGISPDQAKDIVRRLGVTGTLTVSLPAVHGHQSLYQVNSADVSAVVDASTGQLRSIVTGNHIPTTASVRISENDALKRARDYLRALGLSVAGLSSSVRIADHGAYKEFDVTWDRRIHGALTPDRRLVSVNPDTGDVFSVVNVDYAYADPGPAKLDQAAAVTAARTALDAGSASATVDSSDLVITFDANGNQLFVWMIGFVTPGMPPAATLVEVDADSGAATIVGRG